MSRLNNLQAFYKKATIVEKFIYINIAVFILVYLFNTIHQLFENQNNFIIQTFSLPASFEDFIQKPWTIISYGFLHADFIHILLNLVVLYFIGNLFLDYFNQKQWLTFYFMGTFFGGILFLLSYHYFPMLAKDAGRSILLGASASVSAIFIGIATYIPNYKLKIRFIGFVKLWYLAAIWVFLDIIQIPIENAGGHIAHLGGALFGFLYINSANHNSKINIWKKVSNFFTVKSKPLKTVYKSKKKTTKSKSEHQKEIDAILDKISKSGYETLTKEEKAFLFKQGKR